MDAVKFLEKYSRMCNKYGDCVGCPMEGEPLCQCNDRKFLHEESERMVEIVEHWSKATSEKLGKKYIIEVDGTDTIGHCHTCIGWISKSQIETLEEYKESEERMMDGRELQSKLNYLGMSRGIRELALRDNLASANELAVMAEVDVCELVAQKYQLAYSGPEEIGLVHNEDAEKLFDMIEVISR